MGSRFFRNQIFSTIAGITFVLGGFFSQLMVARLVGAEGLGRVALSLWFISLALTVSELGIPNTVSRYIPELESQGRHESVRRLVRYLFKRFFLSLGLVVAVLCIWATFIVAAGAPSESWYAQPFTLFALGAVFLLQGLSNFCIFYLRGMQRFDSAARISLFSVLLQLAAVLCGALVSPDWALLGFGAGQLIGAVYSLRFLRGCGAVETQLRTRLSRTATYVWAANVMSAIVWSRAELFFLQFGHDAVEVGRFSVAITISSLATQGPLLLTGALLPYFSERGHDEAQRETVSRGYATGTRLLALLVFPICFGVAAVCPIILPALFGDQFVEAVPSAMIVVLATALPAISAVGSNLLNGLDRGHVLFWAGVIGAAFSVLSGLTLIQWYGIEGAAWSRALVQTLMVAMGIWYIHGRLHCHFPAREVVLTGVAAFFSAVLAFGCVEFVEGYLSVVLALAVSCPSYVLALRYLRPITADDGDAIRALLVRMPYFDAHRAVWAVRIVAPEYRPREWGGSPFAESTS